MHSSHGLTLLSALAMATSACGDSGNKDGGEPADPTTSGKSDCPDCDPAGPNAFIQTGLANAFYAAGQTWDVAVRYNQTPLSEKGEVFLGEDLAASDVFLFRYTATGLSRAVFQNVMRDVVSVRITQATPSSPLYSSERIDGFEHMVEFDMNDLLEPTRETTYSNDYPNGKTIELDTTESLRTGASLYPRTIPRLLVAGGVASPAPALPSDLADVADAEVPGWQSKSYLKYVFDNGDLVYWANDEGWLWPFYTQNAQAVTLLVRWN
jgi:hypothetical protein